MTIHKQSQTNPVYEAAELYHRLGIATIPIEPGTKEPPSGFRWGEFKHRLPDASERYQWFVEREYHLAVIAGLDFVPLDYDSKTGFESHAAQYPILNTFPRVRTGSGKHHVWVRSKHPTQKYVTKSPDGGQLEVRAGTHYTLAPPSLHPSGEPYRWEVPINDGGIPLIDLESIGLQVALPRKTEPTESIDTEGNDLEIRDIDAICRIVDPFWEPDNRHYLALGLAGWLAGKQVPERDSNRIIMELAERHGDDGRKREFRRAVRDSYRKTRDGISVAGWTALTRIVSESAAKELDLLLRSRDATFTFTEPEQEHEPNWLTPVAELLAEDDEPDIWLVDRIWREQSVGLIVGPPKTFKSFLAMELAISVATGSSMFGMFRAPEPRPVVYIQEESSRKYLRRRFRMLLAGHGFGEQINTMIEDRLFTITNQGFRLDQPETIERLVDEAVLAFDPALIVFDPLRTMHHLNENKAEEMLPILNTFLQLRNEYDLSIAVVHHNNKNPEYTNPGDSVRGSTAIWGAVDAGVFISTTGDEQELMKVNVVLKEGGSPDPFLFGLRSDDDALTFQVVELDGSQASMKVSDQSIINALEKLGSWQPFETIVDSVPLKSRTMRDRLNNLVEQGLVETKRIEKNRKLFRAPEYGDDDEF